MAEASGLESTTVGEILEDKARQNGTKPLIYFKDEVASYEQTNERANRVANWFLSMGFSKGEVVRWEIHDRRTMILERPDAPPSPLEKKRVR